MPAQTKFPTSPSAGDPSTSQAPKLQKASTKAERRELQEKQRAAKEAAKISGAPASSKPSSSTPGSSSSTKKVAGKSSEVGPKFKDTTDLSVNGSGTVGEDTVRTERSRGLRIFSHFGLPKPVGHVVKGDIHPAIVRLGLQFSEFKITGANARCIATLTAFKTVRVFYLSSCWVYLPISTLYMFIYIRRYLEVGV